MTENTTQAAECLSRLTAELGTISDRFSTTLASKKEDIIRFAISKRIGTEWTLESLKGRCYSQKSPSTNEVFYLDGKPLVEFSEVSIEQDTSDQTKHIISASIKYKIISA